MKTPTIAFKNWIDQIGVANLSKKLKVQESTVRHWKRGHCLPSAKQMRKIRILSKGAVTYEAIIDGKEANL